MEHSYRSHFKWGWGSGWYNSPQPEVDYRVSIGSCVSGHGIFRDETIRAATLLAHQFSKPTLVALSGGLDSQVVCLSFKEIGYEFRPLILEAYSESGTLYNSADVEAALEFSKRHKLPEPIVESLNVDKFWQTRAIELSKEHCLSNVETSVQLYLIEKFGKDYSYVMGGGDLVITKNPYWLNKTSPAGNLDPLIHVQAPTPIQQHLIKYQYEGCTKFFMYTPELIAAYLNNPMMKLFIQAERAIFESFRNAKGMTPDRWWWCFNLYVKPLFYIDAWPEISQRAKKTGFELAFEQILKTKNEMLKVNAHLNPLRKRVVIEVPDLIDHLLRGRGSSKIWTNNADKSFI